MAENKWVTGVKKKPTYRGYSFMILGKLFRGEDKPSETHSL